MDDIGSLHILLLVICVLLSGFFSATETALTSINEAKTHQLIEKFYGRAYGLKLWLNRPNTVLTTLLVGNNVVNTLAAALGTVIAQGLFNNYAISIATAFVTLVLLIFGEVTPKTFGKHNAEKFAPFAMAIILPFYWLLWPFVFSLSWIAGHIIRLFGGKTSRTGPLATEEEIAFMIRLGHQEGVLKRDHGKLLESAIEFRDTVVREIMVPRTEIYSFKKNASYTEIMNDVKEHGHSRWPVYDGNIDNIVGILYVKDLLKAAPTTDEEFHLPNYVRAAVFVPETMKLGNLLKEFQHGKAHLAIVVDEYGGTSGIVTLEDVLEELVGEIRDEYDDVEHETLITRIADVHYRAFGRANIHDVGETLGIEFPESDEYESLAGFLIHTHGKLPPVGTEIIFSGWRFKIEDATKKRILVLKIEKLPEQDEELDETIPD